MTETASVSHTQAIKPAALIKKSKGQHLDRASEIQDIIALNWCTPRNKLFESRIQNDF